MRRFFSVSLFLVALLFASSFMAPNMGMAEGRKPVTIEEGSPLSLRVLTRPKAILYKDGSEATVLEGQLPVFKSYYVYTRPGGEARETGTGWYEVGSDEKGTITGWLKASDVFEWKQAMCLAFSHPQGRKPVLMFEDEERLDILLKETGEKRAQDAAQLYAAIDNAATAPLPADFPIISVEPKLAIDITKQFYLLPILEHKSIEMESYEGRKLLLAAVSGKADVKRDQKADIRVNKAALAAATTTEKDVAAQKKDIKFDIVWVMDTTRSMQPYIEEVRNTMEEMSKTLAQKPEVAERIRFGVVGYRDSEEIKDIGYLTKNFTPELQSLEAFTGTLKEVKETTTDSVDVNEDLFAGVKVAIENSAWRDGALRIVIVVGDAPSHEAGHKWNSTKLDEKTLRILASENNVIVFGIHVQPKIRKKYNNLAKKQFVELTTNKGVEGSMLLQVAAGDRVNFIARAKEYSTSITNVLESALKDVAAASPAPAPAPEAAATPPAASPDSAPAPAPAATTADGKSTTEQIHKTLQAGMVTWLGRATETQAPNDIEAWVTDKDLTDPSMQSLDVRLLISKRQLDSLAVMLNEIINAGATAQMESTDFFSALQGVSATAARNADQLAKATSLEDSGLVPAFLQGLPYESQIMTMSPELWDSLGPDEQDQFIEGLRSKISAFESINSTPDQWVMLNQGDAADDFVTPIPLDLLP